MVASNIITFLGKHTLLNIKKSIATKYMRVEKDELSLSLFVLSLHLVY
jgi:hypothetical protein